MWELDYKESWAPKNWCFWTVVLEKTLESPLDWKEIQPVHPKGDQSWVFIGRTDAEAETLIIWPPQVKSWVIGKDPDAGKDWGQEEKGMTEDKTVGWHHRLDGHGFGWTLWVGDGQEGLACCGSWGGKESDMTERLNRTEDSLKSWYIWYNSRNNFHSKNQQTEARKVDQLKGGCDRLVTELVGNNRELFLTAVMFLTVLTLLFFFLLATKRLERGKSPPHHVYLLFKISVLSLMI